MIIKSKQILYLSLIVFCLAGVSVITPDSQSNLTGKSNHEILNETPNFNTIPDAAYETAFQEHVWSEIRSEGNIWAEYSFGAPSIQLAGDALEILRTTNPGFFSIFVRGEWWFDRRDDNAYDNSRVELVFKTTDPEDARAKATWLIDITNEFTVRDYHEEGIWTHDEWWGDRWVTLTTISYRTHVDWPLILEDYNGLIDSARAFGGIIETLDLTDVDHLGMTLWAGQERFYQSFRAGWNSEVEYLEGNFHYSIFDLIPFSTIQRSPYHATDQPLRMFINLPEVTNLLYSSGANYDYHPDLTEPWNNNHVYTVYLEVYEGETYPDFWVDFDYTFVPHALMPIEKVVIDINPFGYAYSAIEVQKYDAFILNWTEPLENFTDLLTFNTDFYGNNTYTENHEPLVSIQLYLNTTTEEYELIEDFIEWVEINYKWEHIWNQSNPENWWIYETQSNIDIRRWEIVFNTTCDAFNWTDALETSDILQESEMLNASNFDDLERYSERYEYHFDKGGYWSRRIVVAWNPLSEFTEFPVKYYSHLSGTNHIFSMADYFGWNEINVSANFYRTELIARVPVYDIDDYSMIMPAQTNDYGFNTYYWYDYGERYLSLTTHLELYANNATYTKDSIDYLVKDFQFGFDYDFHEDSDDIIEPFGDFGWYANDTHEPIFQDHERFWEKGTFADEEKITLRAWDNGQISWWGQDYFDGMSHIPRFGMSSIVNVTYNLIWADLPIYHEDFRFDFQMEYNASWDYWYHDLDTSLYADGLYDVNGMIEDAAGNTGYPGWNFEIDNYNETFVTPATIEFLDPTPLNGSAVNGTVIFRVNLTDDEGVFAATYTKDGTGYVLDENNYISEGIYEIEWNTLEERENTWHLFSLTVWDMEGHKTNVFYNLTVDNFYPGVPPTIEFISPTSPDMELSDMYTFEINITDDWGINSAQAKIDERLWFDLDFNETTELYELEVDMWTLIHGMHTLTVSVIDIDDPQHQEEESINFFVNRLPKVEFVTPALEGEILSGSTTFQVNVTDEIGIESVYYQFDSQPYEMMTFNPSTELWEYSVDVSNTLINGTHEFIVIVRDLDSSQNILFETIDFEIIDSTVIPTTDPPQLWFITPAHSGDTITSGIYTFSVSVTDDIGVDSVKMQVDDGVFIDMVYNTANSLWELEYDLSTLEAGSHLITYEVVDSDADVHTIQESMSIIIDNSAVSQPLYQNVLPGNFTNADDIISGDVTFSIEVQDEDGISGVNIEIYTVTGVDPADVNAPGDVDLSDIRVLSGYPKNMDFNSTDGDWSIYTDTWDTSNVPSGIYLVSITVADDGDFQSSITIQMLLIVKSDSIDDSPFGDIPGFPIEFVGLIFLLSTISIGIVFRKKIKA